MLRNVNMVLMQFGITFGMPDAFFPWETTTHVPHGRLRPGEGERALGNCPGNRTEPRNHPESLGRHLRATALTRNLGWPYARRFLNTPAGTCDTIGQWFRGRFSLSILGVRPNRQQHSLRFTTLYYKELRKCCVNCTTMKLVPFCPLNSS